MSTKAIHLYNWRDEAEHLRCKRHFRLKDTSRAIQFNRRLIEKADSGSNTPLRMPHVLANS
jgi:hypothetical protein